VEYVTLATAGFNDVLPQEFAQSFYVDFDDVAVLVGIVVIDVLGEYGL
jgi:hypothetical protein